MNAVQPDGKIRCDRSRAYSVETQPVRGRRAPEDKTTTLNVFNAPIPKTVGEAREQLVERIAKRKSSEAAERAAQYFETQLDDSQEANGVALTALGLKDTTLVESDPVASRFSSEPVGETLSMSSYADGKRVHRAGILVQRDFPTKKKFEDDPDASGKWKQAAFQRMSLNLRYLFRRPNIREWQGQQPPGAVVISTDAPTIALCPASTRAVLSMRFRYSDFGRRFSQVRGRRRRRSVGDK